MWSRVTWWNDPGSSEGLAQGQRNAMTVGVNVDLFPLKWGWNMRTLQALAFASTWAWPCSCASDSSFEVFEGGVKLKGWQDPRCGLLHLRQRWFCMVFRLRPCESCEQMVDNFWPGVHEQWDSPCWSSEKVAKQAEQPYASNLAEQQGHQGEPTFRSL